MNSSIGIVHHSIRPKLVRKPKRLSSLNLSVDQCELVSKEALAIFTECVNVGVSFQDALVAIYLSGMSIASEATKKSNIKDNDHEPS